MDSAIILRIVRSAAMSGAFLTLLLELRFEHRSVLLDDWRPWIPLFACGLMATAIPIATIFWQRGGRTALFILYCLISVLGLVGFIFHSQGHLFTRLQEVFAPWLINVAAGASLVSHHPPLLAPVAFAGLGVIGILLSIESTPILNNGGR